MNRLEDNTCTKDKSTPLFRGFSPPSYTQIPNEIFDDWMKVLSPSEFKVLLCICRKTFGWHKTRDQISLNQLCSLTNISLTSVKESIKELIKYNLISKCLKKSPDGGDDSPEYEVLINYGKGGGGSFGDRGGVAQRDPTKETLTKEIIFSSWVSSKDRTRTHTHAPAREANKKNMTHDETLPSSVQEKENEKCPELDKMGALESRYQFLKLVVFPDKTRISDRNIETWSRLYPLWTIKKVTSRIKRMLESGKELTNPQGLYFKLLKDPSMRSTQAIEETRDAADAWMIENDVFFRINDDYISYDGTGKDVSLALGSTKVVEIMKGWASC